MTDSPDAFAFEYLPTTVVFGRDSVADLSAELSDRGCSRALVVTGRHVGANEAVMDPLRRGLGDRLAGVFAETTPEKAIGEAFVALDRFREVDADCVVALGGGSSINVARTVCLLCALDRPREDVVAAIRETGRVPTPGTDATIPPNFLVPTTMAGADLTYDGSIRLPDTGTYAAGPEDHRSGSLTDERLMPAAVCYDPALLATTPTDVLTASAMNGFDKGIETVYSRRANPISTAHALEGLRYLRAGLPDLAEADPEDACFDHAAVGIALVQYGRYTNFVHTFGNGVAGRYDVIQGAVHGIVAPEALRYVFEHVDGRRRRIAGALGLDTDGRSDGAVAEAIVADVRAIRDALGLPARLRAVPGIERDHLPELAETIATNYKHERNPPGLDPTVAQIRSVLEAAW
jgi:alcohol dehydrogenase